MIPTSIPGYVQGFVFDDTDNTCYNGSDRFYDKAGYGSFNDLVITTGTPAFVTVGGRRGMVIDNGVQGKFVPAIPWEGTIVMIANPDMNAADTLCPFIFGQSASWAANGKIGISRASPSDYRHQYIGPNSSLFTSAQYTSGSYTGIKVTAHAVSQQTRKSYYTKDALTVTESGALTNSSTIGGNITPVNTTEGQLWGRFGNISGIIGNTTPQTNKMNIFEAHFFLGNPLVDNLALLKAFMDERKAYYGES